MISIVIESTGRQISGTELISATLRVDMVPVPVTLEMTTIANPDLTDQIKEGEVLLIGDLPIPIVLIKVQQLSTQLIRDGQRIGGLAVVGVLQGFEGLIKPARRAIIQEDTTFQSAMRACGGKFSAGQDLPLPKFVCLNGGLPTEQVAIRLQQEAGILFFDRGKVSIAKIDEFFKREPSAKYDPSSVAWENNQTVENLKKSAFYSVGADGSSIENDQPTASRPLEYKPRLDTRQLQNMEKVLVRRVVLTRPLDLRLQPDVVLVGERRLIVVTAAHHIETGAYGGSSAMSSKAWLYSLE